MLSTVLFMFADSAAWLFVARGLQGLATGAALSAASAALLDLHPRRDPAGVGLMNAPASLPASASASSSRRRSSSSGRRRACSRMSCSSSLFAIAFAGVYWMPEPVSTGPVFG